MIDDTGPMSEPRSTEDVMREAPRQPDPGPTTRESGDGDRQGRMPDQEAG